MTIAHWFKNVVGGHSAAELEPAHESEGLDEKSEELHDEIMRSADRVEQIANRLLKQSKYRQLPGREYHPTPFVEVSDLQGQALKCKPRDTIRARKMSRAFIVKSGDHVSRGKPGDYLVTFPSDRQIVMSEDEFKKSFKPA